MAPDEIDRLFVVPPAEFVAARKALASALKAAGRRQEAAAIEKRPRPSVSTWATNQVARSEPDLIRELGEVTARLQAAGGPDYAEAIAQHRAVLKTLRAKAEGALSAAGLRAALPALAQVLQNLRAGMASPATRPLVEAGRLIQDLATAEEASLFDGAGATASAGERPRASAPVETDKSNDRQRDREAREAESQRAKDRERREQRATLQREMMRLRSSVEVAEAACATAEATRAAAEAAREKAEQALAAARANVAGAESLLSAARATFEQKSSELSDAEATLAALD
jgi:hypothetical protein